MYPHSGFGASFDVSYFEKVHGVQRPRLNETNLDPDIIRGGGADASSMHEYSILAKNWNMDITATNLSMVDETPYPAEKSHQINRALIWKIASTAVNLAK